MKKDAPLDNLLTQFFAHDRAALARIITLVENDSQLAQQIFSKLPANSNPYIIGITGSPGTGKSTLITQMAKYLAANGHQVGIISIDPSSPLYGGAFLGDRIRMRDVILNPKVFIRSVASRGTTGGLSSSVYDITQLYAAYGMDYVLIETVGAGQSEIDIFRLAYTILLITVPSLGDSVQAQKAGILEIADIFVINKSDLGGDFLKINLNMMLDSASSKAGWRPPIIRTVATEGQGLAELFNAIDAHKHFLETDEQLNAKKRANIRRRLETLVKDQLFTYIVEQISPSNTLENLINDVFNGSKDIYSAVNEIVEPLLKKSRKIL